MRTSLPSRTTEDRRAARLRALPAAARLTAPCHLAARAVTPTRHGAVRAFVGAYAPTGDHRDLLSDAVTVGAAAAVRF